MDDITKSATQHFRDLEVYRRAFAAAMRIFELTKRFPAEEKFALYRSNSSGVAFRLLQIGRLRPVGARSHLLCLGYALEGLGPGRGYAPEGNLEKEALSRCFQE